MFLRLTHYADINPATVDVAVQGEGDHLFIEPGDLPPWASRAASNFALHTALSDDERVYLRGWVLYVIHLEPLASLCGGLTV